MFYEAVDVNKIPNNPSVRTVMKQLVNALWDKLAQNENNCVLSFIDDFHDLLRLVNDRSIDVTSLYFIHENYLRVHRRKSTSFDARSTHQTTSTSTTVLKDRNVVIASFVTSYARLELYELLHKLGRRMLYCDTDSVAMIANANFDFETGDFLGDLTDQLNCKRPANV